MNTQELIAKWKVPYNYNERLKSYSFERANGGVETKLWAHDQKLLMMLGRKLPGNHNHAKVWVKEGYCYDLITPHCLKSLTEYFEKLSFTPEYNLTKSGGYARLKNNTELNRAIELFYNIKKAA